MSDLWYPNAVRMPANEDLWGSFTGQKPKIVLHTTEGPHGVVDQGGDLYFGRSGTCPNATLAIVGGRWRICHHIPNNWGSDALVHNGPVQTNRANVVQVEIAWTSADIASLPNEAYAELAAFCRWDSSVRGTPLIAPYVFAPAGDAHRMTYDEWLNFSGICGHQHVPENDHTDPGALDVRKLISTANGTPPPTGNINRYSGEPEVAQGATGPAVKDLQWALNMVIVPGHTPLVVDGMFGPATRGTVVQYQRNRNLTVDGIVGRATWHDLGVLLTQRGH